MEGHHQGVQPEAPVFCLKFCFDTLLREVTSRAHPMSAYMRTVYYYIAGKRDDVMMTPKRRFLSFVFACLCLSKPLSIRNWT